MEEHVSKSLLAIAALGIPGAFILNYWLVPLPSSHYAAACILLFAFGMKALEYIQRDDTQE